jgi:hypothetical protein
VYAFRWNVWNREHVSQHGVSLLDVEFVVNNAKPPWPEYLGYGKWRVWGPGEFGRYLQVIYVIDPIDTVYAIHARELTGSEKVRFRRRRR